jgi:hypothetical protein
MAQKMIETVIQDGAGIPHRYLGTTWPAGHMVDLLLDLADTAEGPIADLLRSLVGGRVSEENLDKKIELKDVVDVLKGVRVEGIFARAISKGGSALARRTLLGLQRESGPEGQLDVGSPAGFDSAYSANLPELMGAIRWAVEVNVFPFSGASGPAGSKP